MYFGDDNKGILKNFVEMIINNGVLLYNYYGSCLFPSM